MAYPLPWSDSPPLKRVPPRYSLQGRLLVLLGLLLLTAFLFIGAGIDRFVRSSEEELWRERQTQSSRSVSETVVQFLSHLRLSLALIGGLDAAEAPNGSPAVRSMLVSAPALLEVVSVDRNGRVVAEAHLDEALLSAQPWLNPPDPAPQGADYILGAVGLTAAAQPYVVIATPTAGGGLVAARLSTAALSDLLTRLYDQELGYTYIVTQEGQIIAQSDPSGTLPPDGMNGRPEWAQMSAAPNRGWYGHYTNFQGLEVVGGTAPVAGTNWLVVTEVPYEWTHVMRNQALQLIIASTAFFGLLVMAIGGFVLRRMILLPLASLGTGVERIGQGELDYRIPIKSNDEIGHLALTFNQMAAQLADREHALRKTSDELEARVHERTAALAAANEELRAEVEVRRAAEEALRQSELLYRTLFETAPVGIFTKTLDGRYTSANTADQLYWPRNPQARNDRNVLTLEQAMLDEVTDRQVLERGESVVVEQELPTDQGIRTVLTYKALLYDAANNATGILGVDLDITEWRQAELALRETETRYRTLVEQLPAITYTAALDRCADAATYVSPQISRLGFSPEEWLADPDLIIRQLHPDDYERVAEAIHRLRAAGEPLQIEYRIYTRNGRLLWMNDQANLIYDQSGQPTQIQGMMFDITRRKEAEEALYDSVRRIRLIADNVPALIAYIDNGEIYRFANRQFQEWYATNDIVGRHLRDIAGERQYQAIRNYVDTALSGSPITFDYARVYPDGRRRFVEIAYIPHFAADGHVLGFFTLVQDLTERKVAEEQIKASLEEQVLLIKEIHHRVKNNLQVISSLLFLQSEQVADPLLRTILQDSQNRVKSMALIHEKLYQAKDQARVDVAEYIQNLTGYLFRSYAAQASSIQLHVKVDNVQLGIDTAMPCGLIINELLSNALKHAFPADCPGEIRVELQQEADDQYILLVSDNGVGIPPAFELHKNSSLGLQLVHTLVKQLDGTIEINRNGGAEFRIRFADAH
jgi:PAS domain S-box-containing protein